MPKAVPDTRQRTWRMVGSVLWALIPLLSLGILATVPVLHAALKRRRAGLWVIVVVYVGLTVFALIAIPPVRDTTPGVTGNLATAASILLFIGGTIHAFILRPRVFGASPRRDSPPSSVPIGQQSRGLGPSPHPEWTVGAPRPGSPPRAQASQQSSDVESPQYRDRDFHNSQQLQSHQRNASHLAPLESKSPPRPSSSRTAPPGVLQSTWAVVGSVLWALIPLLSFGLLAAVPALHAALKLRRAGLWVLVVIYVGLTTFAFAAAPPAHVKTFGVVGNLSMVTLFLLMAGATTHAFVLRPRVFAGARRPGSSPVIAPAGQPTGGVEPRRHTDWGAVRTPEEPPPPAGTSATQPTPPGGAPVISTDNGYSHTPEKPRPHETTTSSSGTHQGYRERLSRYEILVLIVSVVGGLLGAVSTILAEALF